MGGQFLMLAAETTSQAALLDCLLPLVRPCSLSMASAGRQISCGAGGVPQPAAQRLQKWPPTWLKDLLHFCFEERTDAIVHTCHRKARLRWVSVSWQEGDVTAIMQAQCASKTAVRRSGGKN